MLKAYATNFQNNAKFIQINILTMMRKLNVSIM